MVTWLLTPDRWQQIERIYHLAIEVVEELQRAVPAGPIGGLLPDSFAARHGWHGGGLQDAG